MNLAVFGATGGTGIVVVRDPSRLPADTSAVTVVRGNLMNPTAIGAAIAGRDAVVSAVGSRDGRAPTSVCTDSAAAIVAAMRQHGTRRLITRYLVKPILGRVLTHAFADMRRMEELVRTSDLEWTIVRPPMLTDGERTGRHRTALNRNLRGGNRISRADLADQLLRCLTDGRTVHATVAVSR
ncbi:NAD(P)-dependent oxidoreductase [Micromonospora sp. LZ34]